MTLSVGGSECARWVERNHFGTRSGMTSIVERMVERGRCGLWRRCEILRFADSAQNDLSVVTWNDFDGAARVCWLEVVVAAVTA